jgi:diaminopimelate decarboxylase
MYEPERRSILLQHAIKEGLLHPEEAPIASFIDWDRVSANVAALIDAFPNSVSVLHAFAVKANSLVPVIRRLAQLGMGAEVASHGELQAAIEAGISPTRIVFDSPAKSRSELKRALGLGVAINVDNFQELARITELRREDSSASEVGIRVNPQVGTGSIAAMSTAGVISKFGVPMRDDGARERLIEAYLQHPWLTRAHAHVGSQGCPLSLIASGISDLVSFADEVNRRAKRAQITTLDIGGGLPVDFGTDTPISAFGDYVDALKDQAPRLFSGDYDIVTEFGRSILAKHGIIATHVEYTKEVGGRRIAITHAGAQVATRTIFMPEAWPLRVQAFDAAGAPKPTSEVFSYDVAGPCCFAGDLLARDRPLPSLDPGDIVAVLDTGAYYASNPFQYNSLPLPGIYGVSGLPSAPVFDTIRAPGETEW